jgi:uncharacterized membrane protein YhaH (DUF805 family)
MDGPLTDRLDPPRRRRKKRPPAPPMSPLARLGDRFFGLSGRVGRRGFLWRSALVFAAWGIVAFAVYALAQPQIRDRSRLAFTIDRDYGDLSLAPWVLPFHLEPVWASAVLVIAWAAATLAWLAIGTRRLRDVGLPAVTALLLVTAFHAAYAALLLVDWFDVGFRLRALVAGAMVMAFGAYLGIGALVPGRRAMERRRREEQMMETPETPPR